MKPKLALIDFRQRRQGGWCLLALMLFQTSAHASIFKGEALDNVADVLTWVVLVIAPIVGIAVFLLIHILPEKIAEKKGHPQTKAIQCLCLLSLVFGGILWPLAWLWAYTKPVIHKLAYGTDKESHGDEERHEVEEHREEIKELLHRVSDLETKEAMKSGGKD
jgi:CBS domain containing-hemolysin-like protein